MLSDKIKEEYRYKYDLHVHTSPASPCGQVDPETTVKHYAELGFNGIVVTNHFRDYVFGHMPKEEALAFYLNDYRKAKEAGKKYGLDVILGLETRYPEYANDYLVYGVDEQDAARAFDYIYKDYRTFYNEFKSDKNLLIQAHPYRNDMVRRSPEILDGIEVYNLHPHHNARIALAAQLAKDNPHFIITGGTDFHHEGHQGMCAMRSKKKISDSCELVRVLKSKDYVFDIWGQIILPY